MSWLSTKELTVLANALQGRDGAEPSEEDWDVLVDWAEGTKLREFLLEHVLTGGFVMQVRDGQVVFKIASFDSSMARQGD